MSILATVAASLAILSPPSDRYARPWTYSDAGLRDLRLRFEKVLPFRSEGTLPGFKENAVRQAFDVYLQKPSIESAYALMLVACFYHSEARTYIHEIQDIRRKHGFSPASYEWERVRLFLDVLWDIDDYSDHRLAGRILAKEKDDDLNRELFIRNAIKTSQYPDSLVEQSTRLAADLVRDHPSRWKTYAWLESRTWVHFAGRSQKREHYEKAISLMEALIKSGELTVGEKERLERSVKLMRGRFKST